MENLSQPKILSLGLVWAENTLGPVSFFELRKLMRDIINSKILQKLSSGEESLDHPMR